MNKTVFCCSNFTQVEGYCILNAKEALSYVKKLFVVTLACEGAVVMVVCCAIACCWEVRMYKVIVIIDKGKNINSEKAVIKHDRENSEKLKNLPLLDCCRCFSLIIKDSDQTIFMLLYIPQI